jgi:hypothetical protein
MAQDAGNAGQAGLKSPAMSALLLLLTGLLVASAPYLAWRGYQHAHEMWPLRITDYRVFRDAGRIIVSDEPSRLYDASAAARDQRADSGSIRAFVNPPAEALLFAPFARLSFGAGRSLFAAVSALAIAAMLLLLLFAAGPRNAVMAGAAVAAVISFLPLYDSVYLGHSDPLYALFIGASLVLLAAGRERLGGAATGLLALKPTLLVLPAMALLLRRPGAGVATVAAAAIVGLAPFLITGPGSVLHYADIVWNRHPDVFRLDSTIRGGAALMFNWNGFVSRLFDIDPPAWVIGPLIAITLAAVVAAMLRGTWEEAYFAGVLGSLVAVPHMANYDWPVLLPAGIFLALRTRDDALRCLLIALDICVNLSMLQHWTRLPSEASVMLTAPVGLLVILYIALRPSLVAGTLPAAAESLQTAPAASR